MRLRLLRLVTRIGLHYIVALMVIVGLVCVELLLSMCARLLSIPGTAKRDGFVIVLHDSKCHPPIVLHSLVLHCSATFRCALVLTAI